MVVNLPLLDFIPRFGNGDREPILFEGIAFGKLVIPRTHYKT